MAHTSPTLLARLRDPADADAWATLLGVYGPLLRGWAERLGARGPDADDLVQDVLAVVVRRFPEFVHPARPGPRPPRCRPPPGRRPPPGGGPRPSAPTRPRVFGRPRRRAPVAPGGTDFGEYL